MMKLYYYQLPGEFYAQGPVEAASMTDAPSARTGSPEAPKSG